MGRKKIIRTEEEIRELNRQRYLKRLANVSRDDITKKCKHTKLNYGALRYDVATLDRLLLTTMYIDGVISILWSNDKDAMKRLRDNINHTINDWLSSQSDWNRKIKIYVFEMPDNDTWYEGAFRNISFQLHVRRDTIPTTFADNVKSLMPLVDLISETIKKTCDETGLKLMTRPSTGVKGMRLKEYVKGLTNELAPETTEPDAS